MNGYKIIFWIVAGISYFYTSNWTDFERGVTAALFTLAYVNLHLSAELDATNERLIKALNGNY